MDRRVNQKIRRARTFEDGIVVRIYNNGHDHDVQVIGRAEPWGGVQKSDNVPKLTEGDEVRLAIDGKLVEICGAKGKARGKMPAPVENTVPPVPIDPGLWLQHNAFWWLPRHSQDPQASMSITPGSELFLNPGLDEAILDVTLNFRGMVGFPEGDDQIIAVLAPVYESAGSETTLEDYTQDISFVLEEDADPPSYQAVGRSFELTYEPSPPLSADLEPSYSLAVVPDGLTPTVLYPVALPQTYGLAMRPTTTVSINYLSGPVTGHDGVDYFTGDGTTTDFHPFADPIDYTTGIGDVNGPRAWIHSLLSPPLVDGVPDTLATFFEGTVRLSYAPDPGATIEIHSNYSELLYSFDTATGDGPEFELTDLVSGDQAYFLLNAFDNSSATDLTDNTLIKADVAVFLTVFAEGDSISFTYSHEVPGGERFNITSLRIIEKNATSGTSRTLSIPFDEPFLAHLKDFSDGSTIFDNDRGELGQLFYDPLTGSYTVAGPVGLIWRDRVEDLEAAGGPHVTITPWPEEAFSEDGLLVNSGLTTVPRKPYPWYGVANAARFTLQCSWNRVGGAEKYPTNGDNSDTADFLRVWLLDEDNVWANIANRPVAELVQSPATGRLNVLGSCYTGINFSPSPRSNDESFPMSRNLVAWLVAAGWNVTGYDVGPGTQTGAADQTPLGWVDAGLTLNAIDPNTGATLSQFTIKCSPTDVHSIYVDPFATINEVIAAGPAFIASVIDKYVNNNPDYWPPASGSVPAQPIIGFLAYGASPGYFEYPPEGGDIFFMVGRLTALEARGAQIVQLPGLPGFSSPGGNGFGIDITNSATNPTENVVPQMMLDDENNIYLYLHTPVWGLFTPALSSANGGVVQFCYGTTTKHHEANGDPQPQPLYEYIALGNLLIFDGDPPQGIVSSNFGLTYAPSFPLFFSTQFNEAAWFYPVVDAGEEPPGTPVFTSPSNDLVIDWKSYTFNPAFATVTGTYTGLPRPIEHLTFSGWEEVSQNYSGFITYDYVSDWTATYFLVERLFLYKIHFDEATKQFSQVWRKDVSDPFPEFVDEDDPPRNDTPNNAFPVRKAIAGRYIFDLRPSSIEHSYTNIGLRLFVWTNGPTAPGDPMKILIDNSTRNNMGITEFYSMIADVDAEGREVVTIWHQPPEASFFDPRTLYLTIITFSVEGDPVVEQIAITSNTPPNFPNPSRFPLTSRMVRLGGRYYWDGPDGKVYVKAAPPPP